MHHIGDYKSDASYLSLQEHGIYFLLLSHYYATEKPIPADKTHTYRIAYARTKKEKSAVDFVLDTFFSLQEDGWHNKRCDEEIAAYKEGDAWHEHKEANKNGQNTRTRRHRKERSRLFAELKDHQVTPEWNMPIKELRLLHKKTCHAPVTAVTPPVTPVTPVTPTQEESFTGPSSSLRSEERLIRAENETSIKELRQWNAKTNAKTGNAPVTAVTAKPLTINPLTIISSSLCSEESLVFAEDGNATGSTGKPKRSPHGSRLPDDWVPSEVDVLYATQQGVDGRYEAEKFRDYWRSVAGAKGRKQDWEATWRNWIRRAAEDKTSSMKHGYQRHEYNSRPMRLGLADQARAFHRQFDLRDGSLQ
ncbi:DUF1376 domain-containing protein [Xylella fastidiosa]|nr:DUF1376 domain-containing protein [Xylella fastidiosa]TNW04838.1 DUF1376 domain-containing protein [Xylella fastidiosa]TNW13845.1 DUF1376 domain-containing protein [Xylella fastidiosa]